MTRHAQLERIAHRGASRERIENTLAAFLVALERGANGIELDVHLSADGRVVVHHDERIASRAIADSRWDDLRGIDLGGGATMPLLDDVLDVIGDCATVYIEMKARRGEEAVVKVAREHGVRLAIHSFDHECIARLAGIAPDVPRGVLLDRGTHAPTDAMRNAVHDTGARDVWPHRSLIDVPLVAAAHELGARVIAWTVNSPHDARRLASLGVDAVCTDDVRPLATL